MRDNHQIDGGDHGGGSTEILFFRGVEIFFFFSHINRKEKKKKRERERDKIAAGGERTNNNY